MITTILTYELKVAILLATFYMFYRLLLSKETFHKVNRCILLFTAIASFVLPFCVITYTKTEIAVQRAFSVEIGDGMLQMVAVDEDYFQENWWKIILLSVMAVGAFVVAFRTIRSIIRVKKIIREGEHRFLLDGTEIVVSDKATSGPFSWMHYIVMSPEEMNESNRSIIRHEQGHIEYGHSWDIIITDLLTSIQWFNPAIWMLRSDLRALHEYQADDYALRSGINAKEYQLLLIKKAISMSGYSVANGFNHSILKNRITMMLSRKSSVRGLMKTLYLIPAVGISLTAFAETKTIYVSAEEEVTNPVTESEVTENPVILQDEVVAAVGTNNPGVEAETDGDEDEAFVMVEEMPKFPEGEEALRKFLAESVKYPEEAKKQGIQGRVFVSFIVDKEGYVKDVKAARKVNKYLDAEAVRVVSSMPRWIPGKQRGEAVRVHYTVPIKFALGENETGTPAQEARSKHAELDLTGYTYYIDGRLSSVEEFEKIPTEEIMSFVPNKEEKEVRISTKVNIKDLVSEPNETKPSFPGGMDAMMEYLRNNTKYPESQKAKKMNGHINVVFEVDTKGAITIKSHEKGNEDFEKEAVRVISSMPNWIPGSKQTQKVTYNIPVMFWAPEA